MCVHSIHKRATVLADSGQAAYGAAVTDLNTSERVSHWNCEGGQHRRIGRGSRRNAEHTKNIYTA